MFIDMASTIDKEYYLSNKKYFNLGDLDEWFRRIK